MLDEQRRFFTLFGIGLALLTLHGPVVGRTDYNRLRYLLAPWVCPVLLAAYDSLRPFNPYESGAAGYAGMVGDDSADPDARRLSTIFASNEAGHSLWLTAGRLSSQLFAVRSPLGFCLAWRVHGSVPSWHW